MITSREGKPSLLQLEFLLMIMTPLCPRSDTQKMMHVSALHGMHCGLRKPSKTYRPSGKRIAIQTIATWIS